MRYLVAVAMVLMFAELCGATELVSEDRSRGWQDREYFGQAYTEYQLGGGDAAAGDSGDAGSSAGDSGDSGTSGEGSSQ